MLIATGILLHQSHDTNIRASYSIGLSTNWIKKTNNIPKYSDRGLNAKNKIKQLLFFQIKILPHFMF